MRARGEDPPWPWCRLRMQSLCACTRGRSDIADHKTGWQGAVCVHAGKIRHLGESRKACPGCVRARGEDPPWPWCRLRMQSLCACTRRKIFADHKTGWQGAVCVHAGKIRHLGESRKACPGCVRARGEDPNNTLPSRRCPLRRSRLGSEACLTRPHPESESFATGYLTRIH